MPRRGPRPPGRPELKDVLAADEAMRTTMGGFNAALQVGYFILAVRAAGLAAGPMGGFDRLPRLEHEDAVRWA